MQCECSIDITVTRPESDVMKQFNQNDHFIQHWHIDNVIDK